MKALITDLKEKINQVIENNVNLLDQIDLARSKSFDSDDAYAHYLNLCNFHSMEEERLVHLRSALVSVYRAQGMMNVDTFYPERQ